MTAPATPSNLAFEPGMVLRNKYAVHRVLGQGGMGFVLEATHLDLERQVAIKVLHPELRTNAEVVDRFLREGRAASRISGEHVARVFDVERLEDGTPILVMEMLEGKDLSYVRKGQTPLPVREAVELVLQACEAVSQAHAVGVIHRDIKPANLFLARQPDGSTRLKVLDFGISKLSGPLGSSEPSATRTSLVMGSVEFMSPEQMLSTRNVDVRTDVWALGVVLFELLTAGPPFRGENSTQVCAHVMSQPAVSPRALRPDIPPQIEQVILKCLEKKREDRYGSALELAHALRSALEPSAQEPAAGVLASTQALPIVAAPPAHGSDPRLSLPTTVLPDAAMPIASAPPGPPSIVAAPPPQPSSTTAAVSSEPMSQPQGRRPKQALALFALAALAAAAVTIAILVRPSDRPQSAASNVETVPTLSSPAAPPASSHATQPALAAPAIDVVPAEAPSAAPSSSSSAIARPSASSAPKPAPSSKPSSKPAPPLTAPRPKKTSGID